ncbi:MAG: S-adenosylhomocysteine hydrolase [Hyphomicrobiales bacterium]|nr:MAG: S-adenosylhomocysteine hydrolase [Hyphomicrobiales bacterium]
MVVSVVEEMLRAIQAEQSDVMLRKDFRRVGSPSQVSRGLRSLCAAGTLVRIGTGLYSKTRLSSVTGQVIPRGSLETLASQAMERLGIQAQPSRATQEYNLGKTTQLPGRLVVNTGRRRISRVIEVGGRRLLYERG